MTEETLRALKGKMSIKAEDLGLADTKSSVVTYLKGYTFTISRSLDNGCTNYFFSRQTSQAVHSPQHFQLGFVSGMGLVLHVV
jgi:hypothetical protein